MNNLTALIAAILSLSAAPRAADLDDFRWTQDFSRTEAWTPQPTWLSNPSSTAAVTSDGSIGCFAVDEPGRGMKWSGPLPAISLEELPWLVARYRAENLDTSSTDYLVYLNDRGPGEQLSPLRFCDVKCDGQWHTAAVDLSLLTNANGVSGMAVQVQASQKGKGRLWLEFVSFQDQPPRDAEVLARSAAAPLKPDRTLLPAAITWTARPDWLGNPAVEGKHRAEPAAASVIFRVEAPGRGMKWTADLPEPISLAGHRYGSFRYRARNLSPQGDYALSVLGQSVPGGPDSVPLVASAEPIADGRWHTLDVLLGDAAAKLASVTGLAMQTQAAAADAWLEVSEIRLSNTRQPSRLADALDWRGGAEWAGFEPVPLAAQAGGRSNVWRSHLRLADWFDRQDVTAAGIPFRLTPPPTDLAVTPLRAKSQLRLLAGKSACEVYLLVLAAMTGQEEPAHGSGRLQAIGDVDRFRIRLEYADGSADECLPMNAITRQFGVSAGVQVLVAPADSSKRLETLAVCDATRQAAFGIAGVTIRAAHDPLYPEALDPVPLVRPGAARVLPAKETQPQPTLPKLEAILASSGPPALNRLTHGPTGWDYLAGPCPLVELRVDGKAVSPSEIEPLPAEKTPPATRWYRAGSSGIRVGVTVENQADRLGLAVELHNTDTREHRVALTTPTLTYRLAQQPEQSFYLFPKRGAAFDQRDCSYRERYCGSFPLQFLDTFAPSLGRGLSLRTEDTQCVRKNYLLAKQAETFTIGVEYPEQTLPPGERFQTPRAVLAATDGDWHRGLEAYREWLASWHRPLSPRKPWFREVFNFRQRFLWALDPLYDAGKGSLHLDRAVEEARREFGGIDYLHLFDWGNCGSFGRIYGRIGDHSPYDYLHGGREALAKAIAGVQAQNVPVGLYIEGYLLEERGKLGRQFGRQWQSIGPDGKGRYWPQCTEMYACAGVPAWQEAQASTYAAKVRELGADGMYLDQFGFAGENQDCWAKGHGHAEPSYAVVTERDCTRAVRQRIDAAKTNVALYTEESPVDVTSQYQDGSFTYAMFSARRSPSRVPLNLTRFALPDFKTIEILFCDGPTGSWATGVKWVFFNGEAIWLEGSAVEWFEPETRETIRRGYAILRKHRDAFTSLRPVPLVPTEQGGVFANAFPAEGKTVYTFYNARRVTVRGPVLRLPRHDDATAHDEWNGRPARLEQVAGAAILHLELGPCDVGCVVVRP